MFAVASLASLPSSRYVLGSWPLFVLLMPLFMKQVYDHDKGSAIRLVVVSCLTMWTYPLTGGAAFLVLMLALAIGMHWYAWRIVRDTIPS
ncbi:MAG: hypothetical protein HOI95_30415 [Chromatiales bacterium]|nr:hypothetical protein [Chromatiales bacterium]